jgi:hypothetical protein
MSLKLARETFKEMLALCYSEDYPELHVELLTLEKSLRGCKEINKYETGMQEILSSTQLFADDFPDDIFSEIEELFQGFLEELE